MTADLLAALLAEPGVEERCRLDTTSSASGRFGFLALHGGLEEGTAEIAEAAADACGASLYAVVQPDDLRWHVPSRHYVAGTSDSLDAFCAHVDAVISLHGYGGLRGSDDRWTTVLLGGRNRPLASRLAGRLSAALSHYTWLDDLDRMPEALRGLHAGNPVNRPSRAGVQVELPPRIRGFGPFWAQWREQNQQHEERAQSRRDPTTSRARSFPPHTATLVAALAAAVSQD